MSFLPPTCISLTVSKLLALDSGYYCSWPLLGMEIVGSNTNVMSRFP